MPGPPGPPVWGPPPTAGPPAWVPPARPGVVPLRPLGLGDLLDGAVRTMRYNPKVMFGLSALVMGVAAVLSTLFLVAGIPQFAGALDVGSDGMDGTEVANALGGSFTAFVLPTLVQAVAQSVLNGILIVAIGDAVIARRPTMSDVLNRVRWRGIGKLVLLTVVTGVIGIGAAILIFVPVLGLFVLALPLGVMAAIVGLFGFLAAAVYLFVRLAFAAPALMLENLGIRAALQRSWRLGKGSSWRILGILALSSILGWVVSSVLQFPFSLVGSLVGAAIGADSPAGSLTVGLGVSQGITSIGAVLGATVVSPFTTGVLSLLYIDLRIRREGLDVALARAAHANATS